MSRRSGADPFAVARQMLGRLDGGAGGDADVFGGSGRADDDAPPFIGGLAGYLAYDLGHALERLPTMSTDDQGLPLLRLALHDWVIAWDRRTGAAWLAVARSMATSDGSIGGWRRSASESAGRRWPSSRAPTE